MVSDTLEKKEKKYNRIPNVMHLKKNSYYDTSDSDGKI
jgi:hypothetical protein